MRNIYKTTGLLLAASWVAANTISTWLRLPLPGTFVLALAGGCVVWLLVLTAGLFRNVSIYESLLFAAVLYFGYFAIPFWFLVEPHEWGGQLIKAYWPWWVVLLFAAVLAEGVGVVVQKESGDPNWRRYPFIWGPNHRVVVFPIFWVAVVEVLLTVGEYFRPLITEGAALPTHPFLRWWATVAVVWAGVGDGAALLMGVLTPAIIVACFLSVFSFAATVAAKEVVRREREAKERQWTDT